MLDSVEALDEESIDVGQQEDGGQDREEYGKTDTGQGFTAGRRDGWGGGRQGI